MKVEGTGGSQPARTDSASDARRKDDSKSFSKLLKKPGAKEEGGEDAKDPALVAAPPLEFRQNFDVAETTGPQAPRTLDAVQALAQEISVVTNERGASEVQIQFDSKTLDGLRVHISKEDGQLNIQFFAKTPEVANLLTANAGQLQAALAQKGTPASGISVQGTRQASWQKRVLPQGKRQRQ